jgi:hypothetical protein
MTSCRSLIRLWLLFGLVGFPNNKPDVGGEQNQNDDPQGKLDAKVSSDHFPCLLIGQFCQILDFLILINIVVNDLSLLGQFCTDLVCSFFSLCCNLVNVLDSFILIKDLTIDIDELAVTGILWV